MGEVRVLGGAVTPVGLGDAEVLQQRLRAQEPRRQGDGRDAVRPQLGRLRDGQPDHRRLRHVVEEGAAVAGGVAVGDLHDQAALAGDHEGQRVPAGDHVGLHRPAHEEQALVQVLLPHRVFPVGERVAAPDGVDQDVEPAVLLRRDPRHEGPHLFRVAVVGADRDAHASGGGDLLGRLLDGLGAVEVGAPCSAAAARHVDGRAGDSELDGDSPPTAPGAARDQRDLSGELSCLRRHLFSRSSSGFTRWR